MPNPFHKFCYSPRNKPKNFFVFSTCSTRGKEMTSYVCARKECRKEIDEKKLATLPGIKCPYCGYRILYKKRPVIIKRIKAI